MLLLGIEDEGNGSTLKLSEKYKRITNRSYFYNIMPIANIPSVLSRGIISYHNAEKILGHSSIAMSEVQNKRENTLVAGRSLHNYANMYFSARNPMMYKRKDQAEDLCVLAVSTQILDDYDCIVTDRNAASPLAKFYDAAEGIEKIDFQRVFADFWVHQNDYYDTDLHKKQKCAEILVLDEVPFQYIVGAYVVNEKVKQKLIIKNFKNPIQINTNIFFW